jgi:predicted acyltransferase
MLNWSPFVRWTDTGLVFKSWENTRILGVLQRIALCYFFASVIVFYGKTKGAFYISALLLLAYWFICYALNPTDPYSFQGWFGTKIDIAILGESHVYRGEGVPFDPEGFMSTPAAIVQVVFGFLAGQYIQLKGKNYEMLTNLFIAGLVMIATAYFWDMSFPINKKIWTSSYALHTSGLAILCLGVLIYIIEFKETKGAWSRFFDVFGKNPLFIFVLSGFLPRLLALFRWETGTAPNGSKEYTSVLPWFYRTICEPISKDLRVGSLIYALVLIFFYWSIVYMLDKKKIYIKV